MSRRTTLLLFALTLVAGVFLVYAPVAHHDWVAYDDDVYLLENPHVARGLEWSEVRWVFTHAYAANYHPLTWLSHMLDVELFGLEPGSHQLVNAGLHALNTVLVLLFLAALFERGWAAGIGAALFALHPLRVESVAWAAERKDVLCAAFFLAGLLAYLGYVRRPSFARYALVAAALVLALLSKPMAVSFPFALFLLDLWPLRRLELARLSAAPAADRALVLEKLPLFALAGAGALVTLWAQSRAGATSSLVSLEPGLRLLNALATLATYVEQTLVPHALSVFYPHALQLSDAPARALLVPALAGAALLGGGLALAWRMRRSQPTVAVGTGFFLLTLAPVIGLVQVGAQAHADRYTYLPSVGLSVLACTLAAASAARHARVVTVLGAGLALLLGVLARRQVGVWQDTRTLFEHALALDERNYLAHSKLGEVARAEGDLAGALAAFERALEHNPGHVESLNLLALCHLEDGALAPARALLERARAVAPDDAQTWLNLGMLELDSGDAAAARRCFESARRLDPASAQAPFNLAYLEQSEQRYAEAEGLLEEALARERDFAEAWSNLGQVRLATGKLTGALQAFEEAARLAPDDPLAHFNLGKARERGGDKRGAAQAFRRTLQLDPEFAPARAALQAAEEGG